MLAENLVAQNINFLSGFGNCSSIGIDSDFQTGNLQACKHFLSQVLLLKISCCCAVENKEETGRGSIQNFSVSRQSLFLFIYLLAVLGLHCCAGFLYLWRMGAIFIVGPGLLIAVASLVLEHGL